MQLQPQAFKHDIMYVGMEYSGSIQLTIVFLLAEISHLYQYWSGSGLTFTLIFLR